MKDQLPTGTTEAGAIAQGREMTGGLPSAPATNAQA